jgi:hypothetical protein
MTTATRRRPATPTPTASRRSGDPLQQLPGVGPSIARDLRLLGFRAPADLRGRDPEAMYLDLCRRTGQHQDRCVLYVFRCAVYYASRERHDPRLLRWWAWKDAPLPRSPTPDPRPLIPDSWSLTPGSLTSDP